MNSGHAREQRFAKAAEVLIEARIRNRPVEKGGCGCPILVEGKRDRRALRSLGFRGPIELVNRGWGLERLCGWLAEFLAHRNPIDGREALILLMDWDRTGGRLQRELKRRLETLDIKVDGNTRSNLSRVLRPDTTVVEGLYSMSSELRPLMKEMDPMDDEE